MRQAGCEKNNSALNRTYKSGASPRSAPLLYAGQRRLPPLCEDPFLKVYDVKQWIEIDLRYSEKNKIARFCRQSLAWLRGLSVCYSVDYSVKTSRVIQWVIRLLFNNK